MRALGGAIATILLASCRINFDGEDEIAVAMSTSASCSPPCTNVTLDPVEAPAGALLVAMLYTCAPPDNNCPTPTLVDTAGSSWSAPIIVGTQGHGADYLWFTCGAAAGTHRVSVSNAAATYSMLLHLHAVSGIAATDCLDASGTATGVGVTASVTTSSPVAQANEYVVGFFGNNASAGPITYAPGLGYVGVETQLNSNNETAFSEAAASVTGLSGLQTATATQSMPGATWQATIATFVPDL